MYTDKRFWKYVLPTVFFLGLYPITVFGHQLSVIALVVVTFAIVGICAWHGNDESKDAPSHLWLMMWLGALCGYIADVVILSVGQRDLFVMQLYFYPIWIAYSGLICFAGYLIRAKIYNENGFRTAMSIAVAFVGAVGAGITIGNGWSFALLSIVSIAATWHTNRMLRHVPDVGFAIIWKWPYKYEITQRGKTKERLEPADYLYSFKKFFPIYVAISFIFSAALFGGHGSSKPEREVWTANGLTGHITTIHYISKLEAIALASAYGPERPDSAAIYRSVDGGHNWSRETVLPGGQFFGKFVIHDNMLSSIVRCGDNYRLLTFNINTGEYSLSEYDFGINAILLSRKDGIHMVIDSVLYKAGVQLDSIDMYDSKMRNAGFAELNQGLFGFIWDNKQHCSRLFNFSRKQIVDTVTFNGPCFIVKSTYDKAIVGGIQNSCANCYELSASTDVLKRVSSHHKYTNMSDLREDNSSGTIACIISDGPFDDRVVKYSTDYGDSWHIKDLGVSPIEAWCIFQDRLYYLSNHKMYMVKL